MPQANQVRKEGKAWWAADNQPSSRGRRTLLWHRMINPPLAGALRKTRCGMLIVVSSPTEIDAGLETDLMHEEKLEYVCHTCRES